MADEREYDLSTFEDFAAAVAGLHPGLGTERYRVPVTNVNGYYCVRCAGKRRMVIERLYWGDRNRVVAESEPPDPLFEAPAVFKMSCVQCTSRHTVLVHEGPDGYELAIFSAERGGFSTPNTPSGVAYYLDQAHRAESVGATSAAAGMYRSALEMLLYEQRYTGGMLGKKIIELLADANPPRWREQIDQDYLDALKEIGNGAMHPNDGDVERQKVLDRELLTLMRAVFEELLDWIYERPVAEAARKAKLLSAGKSFKATAAPAVPSGSGAASSPPAITP